MKKPSLSLVLLCGLLAVVGTQAGRSQTPPPTAPVPPTAAIAQDPKYALSKIELEDIENVFRVGPKIISGSCPHGEEGYAALSKAGVKTIVSVDGSRPEVEIAKKYGMRYVHIPVEYAGITRGQALRIAKAVSVLPGPIFIHCHHGIHRGPAAATLAAIGALGWQKETALELMKEAGTDAKYQGLWDGVRNFVPPTKAELDAIPDTFEEVSPVPSLAKAMIEIDDRFDHLKAVKKADWGLVADHPDIDPPHEALILSEHFRELAREEEVAKKHPAQFLTMLRDSEAKTVDLQTALAAIKNGEDKKADAATAFDAVSKSCGSCHKMYRDNMLNEKDPE